MYICECVPVCVCMSVFFLQINSVLNIEMINFYDRTVSSIIYFKSIEYM